MRFLLPADELQPACQRTLQAADAVRTVEAYPSKRGVEAALPRPLRNGGRNIDTVRRHVGTWHTPLDAGFAHTRLRGQSGATDWPIGGAGGANVAWIIGPMDTDRRLPSQAERVTSVGILGTGLLLLTVLAACAPPYSPRVAQYQNIVLNARELGAKQLDIEMQRDPAIRDYVARNGNPDFIYVPSATVVELIYFQSSKLILFYRDQSGAGSVTGELSPLPLEVTNVLPVDIRAGTPGPIARDTLTSCWTVSAATHRCHTCCEGPLICSTSCKEETLAACRQGIAPAMKGPNGDRCTT